ncbi:hypothetical protein M2M59_11115 [Rummeliibacillus sp. G93]|uniref:Peptidase M4 n=1 Tax=Rummeliibacillus stabekisii TaxID=241244 RepID=A0A143HD33_9BACL|nr:MULTISPECIES: peptidase M4 [Rummeliibacillus]AMW99648.1 peptidase M4 [Rummeliibacillus stabekisii]MBB5168683.1 putative small secreted protein [Rummeliibacillus stabekisii]MCM3317038.1 hypothetical protein [Rummeliibacillus stabekisii]UQW96535.1 hypothetical protein M2M59_11115 [Rummeliibacillus sp. G93]GEL05179.1 hypothetical protein RST01_18060 [Rummeliibacillus stabekisii]
MKLGDFLLGVATGISAAYVVKRVGEKVSPYENADHVLNNIKEAFKEQGPIDGSWIYMQPETVYKENIEIPVYKGGISRVQEGETVNFEFSADARTGSVVDLVKV